MVEQFRMRGECEGECEGERGDLEDEREGEGV